MNTLFKYAVIFTTVLFLSSCSSPEGVSFDQSLVIKEDGLVYGKNENALFTGKAYMEVCQECSKPLLGYYPIHWLGSYKNGKPHGVFWFPASGRSDDTFQYKDRESQSKVVYKNGQRVDQNP